jgi:hemerythrin
MPFGLWHGQGFAAKFRANHCIDGPPRETSVVLIDWNDRFELGVGRMDAAHREFINLLGRMNTTPREEMPALFALLVEHTERHFGEEDRWMQESGFPLMIVHRDEHERVLAILRETLQQLQAGDAASGYILVQEMLAWFEQHAASMDLALARHIEAAGFPVD